MRKQKATCKGGFFVLVNPTHHWASSPNPHDIIHFSTFEKQNRNEEIGRFYAKGLSLREIERRAGVSKTKIRKILLASGKVLRPKASKASVLRWRNRGKQNAKPPYGFCYFEGQITKHPKEYPHLLAIIGRWKSGHSLNSIAKWLNGKRVPSPMGKLWSFNSIDNIIKRIKTGRLVQKGEKYELR